MYILNIETMELCLRVMYFDMLLWLFLMFRAGRAREFEQTPEKHIHTLLVSSFIVTLTDVIIYVTDALKVAASSVPRYILTIDLSLHCTVRCRRPVLLL